MPTLEFIEDFTLLPLAVGIQPDDTTAAYLQHMASIGKRPPARRRITPVPLTWKMAV
ncbi:MAG: hypothetical protein ACWGG5_08060 [Stenotrophomonas sp.]